ncbi:HDOD domain-containing protein [Aquipseudomonas alcaligenes]|uniref:HDOD domain-containing protein n=1 Tax=Aquipseudomonas alcaligenes TaxID=43263 RepID=UPI0036669AD0
MFAAAAVPDVLIAEADPWTADLLAQLILAARPDAHIQRFTDGEAALARCRRKLPDLVIADGELPGLDGIELLRQLRRHPRIPALPCVLISSRVDAASVRAVLPLAPAAYLAKPFNAEQLRQRLDGLLPAACNESLAAPAALLVSDLGQYLDDVREEGQGAPLLADIRGAVSSSLQAYDTDLGQLAREFARDPQITARLIAAANSAAEQRGGICQTLTQALQRIGVARALNLVLGMAVQRNARLQDPRLAELASQVGEQAQRSAELALLRSLQDWQDAGGELGNDDIEQALRRRAAGFGSALRIRWRLPFGLRELIAAYYALGSGVFSREALVLNLVAQLLALPSNQPLDSLLESRPARMLGLRQDFLGRIPEHLLGRHDG